MNKNSKKNLKPENFPAIKIRIRKKDSKGIIYKVKNLPVYFGNSIEKEVLTLEDETLEEKELQLVNIGGKIYLVNLTNKDLKVNKIISKQGTIELIEGITELKLGKYLINIKITQDTGSEDDEDITGGTKPNLTKREKNIILIVSGVLIAIVTFVLLFFIIPSDRGDEGDAVVAVKINEPEKVEPNAGDKFSVFIKGKFNWDPGLNYLIFKIVDTTRSDFKNYRIKLIIPGVKKNRDEYTIEDYGERQLLSNNIKNGVIVTQELYFDDPGTRQSTLTVQRPGDDAIVVRKFTVITKKPPGRDMDSVEIITVNHDDSEENSENIDDYANITVGIPEEVNKVDDIEIILPPLPEGITFKIMPMGNSDTVVVKITFPGLIPFKIDKDDFNVGNGKLTNQGKMLKAHYIKYGNKKSVPPIIQLKFAGYLNELRTYTLPEVGTISVNGNEYLLPLPDGILVSLFPGGERSKAIRISAPVEIEIDSLESVNGFCTTLGKKTKYHFITYDKPELVPATVRIKFKGYLNELRTYAVEKR